MELYIEQNVHRLIRSKGWTIYRLSKNSGVPLTVLYSLGKKKSGPTTETLIKIAKALDVTVDELITERRDKFKLPANLPEAK